MNKKVLTLCAGFLLAGSAFTSVNAENFEEAAKVKDGVFLVYVNGTQDISTDANIGGSDILSPDAEKNFHVKASEENKKDKANLWKVTEKKRQWKTFRLYVNQFEWCNFICNR